MFGEPVLDRESIEWAEKKHRWKRRNFQENTSGTKMTLRQRRRINPDIEVEYDPRGKLLSAERRQGRRNERCKDVKTVRKWMAPAVAPMPAYYGGGRSRFGIRRMPFWPGAKRLAFTGTFAVVFFGASTSATIWAGFGAVAYGVYVVWRMGRPA